MHGQVYTGESSHGGLWIPHEVRSMNPPGADKVRDALSQGHWDQAVALLQQLDPAAAADVMMGIPFEEQRVLFRIMPDDFAAHSGQPLSLLPLLRPAAHAVDGEVCAPSSTRCSPTSGCMFFDELPEEAWQRLMDELSGAVFPGGPRGGGCGRGGRGRNFQAAPGGWSPSPRPCRLRNLSSSPTAGKST